MQLDQIRIRLDSEFKAQIFEFARERKTSVSQLIKNLLFNEVTKKNQSN